MKFVNPNTTTIHNYTVLMALNSCYVLVHGGRNELEESLESRANRCLHSKRHPCCFVFFWHALPSSWWIEESISSCSSLGKWTLRETIPKFALSHAVLSRHMTSQRKHTDPVGTFGCTASTLLCMRCGVTVTCWVKVFYFLLLAVMLQYSLSVFPSSVFTSCSCITHWLGT